MDKRFNDKGEVAVIISPGFGAGWYSWNKDFPDCLFDPDIVQMILDGDDKYKIQQSAEEKWPDGYWSADKLKVRWIKPGKSVRISEYDGSESIEVADEVEWINV